MNAQEARQALAMLVAEEYPIDGPPDGQRGFLPEDLRGRTLGAFVVVGYLVGSRISPWWTVRCTGCGVLDVRRGNAIRAGVSIRHRCPKAAP